ncbi:MAG: hypothetical protein GY816_02375, partial [Cytophagales bacterium]|nr:hypothetical protein [Cytophagales bacterium]
MKKIWGLVHHNNKKAQVLFAHQYDKKRKDHVLKVGDRILWFRPQDLKGDLRTFAMPFVGPYLIESLSEFHTAKIILESDDQSESIHVNVDQLSLCYPEFSPKTTLDFPKIKRWHRANRKRFPGEVYLASLAPFRHSTLLKGIIRRNREEKQLEEEVSVENVPKIIVTSICMMRSVYKIDKTFIMAGEASPQVEQREAEM